MNNLSKFFLSFFIEFQLNILVMIHIFSFTLNMLLTSRLLPFSSAVVQVFEFDFSSISPCHEDSQLPVGSPLFYELFSSLIRCCPLTNFTTFI